MSLRNITGKYNFQLQKLQARSNELKRVKIMELQKGAKPEKKKRTWIGMVLFVAVLLVLSASLWYSIKTKSEYTMIFAGIIPFYCVLFAMVGLNRSSTDRELHSNLAETTKRSVRR